MTRIAISIWEGRVSPVFDVAKRLLIVDIENNHEVGRYEEIMPETELINRAGHVVRLGVQLLICGAISWPLEGRLIFAGVRVISQTCGLVEGVLRSFIRGNFDENMFLMPGCGGRRSRFQGRYGQRRGRWR